MKIEKLLTTEYESRNKIGLTDSQIDVLILLYYTKKNVRNRFDEMDKSLPKIGAEAIRAKTDSVLNSIEAIKRDLKDN